MFSSNLPRLLWEGLAFILIAMVLLDPIMLYVAAVYIIFLILAIAVGQPRGIKIKRERTEFRATVGDIVEVSTQLCVDKGVGIVTIADKLPAFFRLDTGDPDSNGSSFGNFRVLWKGTGRLSEEMRYRLELTKRGVYAIAAPAYETLDVATLKQSGIGSNGQPMTLIVSGKPIDVRGMRSAYIRSSIPMPLNTLTNIGTRSNEFLEIREYTRGDPYNRINWKATARLNSCKPSPPLMNEYELEGKKTVWIFLDNTARMCLGTDLDNVFEYGVKAASSLSSFYLARGCKVGMSLYDGDTLLPDTGRRQEYRIASALLRADVDGQPKKTDEGEASISYTYEDEGSHVSSRNYSYSAEAAKGALRHAIDANRWHLVGQSPLFLVITMVNKGNIGELLEGIKRLRLYSIANRSQVIVIDILGYDIIARGAIEEAGAQLLDYNSAPAIRKLRATGAYVVQWDAKKEKDILKKIARAGGIRK